MFEIFPFNNKDVNIIEMSIVSVYIIILYEAKTQKMIMRKSF